MELQKKFEAVEEFLNKKFTDREEMIRYAILSLLTVDTDTDTPGAHMCVVSTPGCAKSAVINSLMKFIENDEDNHKTYWYGLFHSHIKPDEIFGPLDIKKYTDEGVMKRNSKNYLPNAKTGFGDEIWKADNVMNSMLQITNEREVLIDGEVVPVPLNTLFSASNEWPTNKELEALFDRFLYRIEVLPIQDREDLEEYLMGKATKAKTMMLKLIEPPVIKFTEIRKAQEEVGNVEVTKETVSAFVDCLYALSDPNINITLSNRRHGQCIMALKAIAWYNGRNKTEPSDVAELWPCMWVDSKDIPVVKNTLNKNVNKQAVDIYETYDAIRAKVQEAEQTRSYSAPFDAVNEMYNMLKSMKVTKQNQFAYNKVMKKTLAMVIPLGELAKKEKALAMAKR